jgi:tripartite-type tricarboxylate transporter receptor subunit TctC
MATTFRRRCIGILTLAAATLPIGAAQAQAFPARPIAIVVPYAAGGPTDITARRLAEALTKSLAATVIVENRPGAATTIAAAYVAKAPKDGYTLLMAPGTTTSINPYLYSKLSYNLNDFAPVSQVSRQGFAITTSPTSPAKTVQDLVAWARAKGSPLTYGTTGTGSMTNILGEWIGRTLGVRVAEIPYKGTSQILPDLISGRLDLSVDGLASAVPYHASGKVKVLGIMTEERSAKLSDVETTREAGYPSLVAYTNFGLLAPAGTPPDIVEKLHRGVVAAASSPEFVTALAAGGEQARTSASPQQFMEFLRSEYAHWGPIIKPLNLKLD